MIQALRRKFIATNMILVSLVLAAVFAVQVFSAYRRAEGQVLRAQVQTLGWMTHAADHTFRFEFDGPPAAGGPEPDISRGDRRQPGEFPSAPTFAVEVDGDGTVTDLMAGPGSEVTRDTAQQLTDQALAKGREQGSLAGQDLAYLLREEAGKRYLVFADNSMVAAAVWTQARASFLICAAALLVFYLISQFLAKLALKPVEAAWTSQRQFVADASHELKTPITVILANADVVLAHPGDTVADQSKWLGYIQDEALGMKKLVEDLLFLAKGDARQSSPPTVPVLLSQVVNEALLSFEPVAFEAGITLDEAVTPELWVKGDEGQLRRVVMILLDNAVKYAGEQGTVTVTLAETGDRITLRVHNTGAPIDAQHLPHIFERFYRADAARNRDRGGYGLGLSIAKTIADAHGAKLTADSGAAEGTTFTAVFSSAKGNPATGHQGSRETGRAH